MYNKGGFLPSDIPSEGNPNSDYQNPVTSKSSLNGGIKQARCTIKLISSGEIVDGKLFIKNYSLTYVTVIGCARNNRQTSNGLELAIEDGTGGLNVRVYQDKIPPFEIRYS